ncbi:hypothetical protein GGR51DRAFT_467894 [Nemania sp. FL0031]|nr:hypothetical protein GGR51DRAFT_467894 [Nemania sp. FL0031]
MRYYNFLFETAWRKQEESHGPSWVLDLACSDISIGDVIRVAKARKVSDPVTLGAFINSFEIPTLEGRPDTICFATPRTLFCTGCYIDEIYRIHEVPSVGNDDPGRDLTKFVALIRTEVEQLRVNLVASDIQDSMEESDSDDEDRPKSLFVVLFLMLTLCRDGLFNVGGDFENLVKSRNSIVAGKPVIITRSGLVGICATPVLPGDYLCWVNTAPSYLILRLIEGRYGDLDAVKKHRIVSRVLLSESLTDKSMIGMTEKIESLPMRHFQIV